MALILLCMFCWALWCVRFCVFVARLQRPSSPVQRKAKGINVRHQRGVSAHKHKPRAVQRLSEKWVSKRAKKRRKQWKSSVCFRVFVWRDISMGATDPIMIEYFIALTHPLALRSSSKLGGSISSHHQQRSGSFFFFWPPAVLHHSESVTLSQTVGAGLMFPNHLSSARRRRSSLKRWI